MSLDHFVYSAVFFSLSLSPRLVLIPGLGQEDHCYGAYMTEDKVGLIIMPLDGNPHNSMALIAHPSGVGRSIASSLCWLRECCHFVVYIYIYINKQTKIYSEAKMDSL